MVAVVLPWNLNKQFSTQGAIHTTDSVTYELAEVGADP